MHTIENEELRVMISDHGAELSGIFDKKNNREVGSIRGWTVNYTYMGERPSVLTFVEDKDLYDAFLCWQGDKSKRPFPRKHLNKHWHIEYQQ